MASMSAAERNIIKRTFYNQHAYVLKDFYQYLEGLNLVYRDGRKTKHSSLVDITGMKDDKLILDHLFKNLKWIYKRCEEFDYVKGYRYSYLFKLADINYLGINEYFAQNKAIRFTSDNRINDNLVSQILDKPTIKETDSHIYFKFSLKVNSFVPNTKALKHTVLAVLHKDAEVLEVRQDIIPATHNNSSNFYETHARSANGFVCNILNASYEIVDIQSIIKYMKSRKMDEVSISAVRLLRDGTEATLDSCGNQNMILPILGELNNVLEEDIFKSDIEQVALIYARLKLFIREIEERSALPAAKVYWKETGDTVTLIHESAESELSYLKWIGNLKGKEEMNYVTHYIIGCRNEIEAILNAE